ncbi:polyadenylate-binding protein-interacting protein 1-like [Styela clava]
MADRGTSNGQNWQERGSPYWNARSEPEIDVWDPTSVSSNNYASSTAPNQVSSQQSQPSNVPASQPSPNVNNYTQNNMSANWGSGSSPTPQQAPYRHPNSGHQQSMPGSNAASYDAQPPILNSQYYDQYSSNSATAPTPQNAYSSQTDYSPQQYQNNSRYQYPPAPEWPAGSWRSQSNVNSYRSSDFSEPYNDTPTAKKFSNPLMNSNESAADSAADLVKQLHIQGQNDQRNIDKAPRNPAVISNAALAMLKSDLRKAAVAFESAENLELARNIHLGLVDVTTNLGQNVVVSNLSAEAADFVPRATPAAQVKHVPEQAPQDQEDALIGNLKFFIENILTQPGNFDDLVSHFIEQVKYYIYSDEVVEEMVNIIFTKAIDEDNFKYLGARLCDYLTKPGVLSNFRSIFLNHFQTEFKNIRDLIDGQKEEDVNKIHGFLMFMAEIFIHIKINGTPVIALGRSLSKTLENLLLNPTIKNVTFVCKVLKLAGGKLIDAFHRDEEDMKNYQKNFATLNKFSDDHKDKSSGESKTIVLLISSVSRLKDSNWGRTKSNTRPKSSIGDAEEYGDALSEVDQNYYMNEPVFFTPEGVQYTAAEAQIPEFYQQHLARHGLSHFPLSEDGESLPWSQGVDAFDDFIPSDDEVEFYRQDSQESDYTKEYEKFLRDSSQL